MVDISSFDNLSVMQKKMSNIFATYVLGYDNPNFLSHNEQIKNHLNNIEFSKDKIQPYQTIDNHLEKHEELKSFYAWVEICLEDYRRTFKYNCDGFKIILSWANKSDKNGGHRSHVHPNSFISGIYYVSDELTPTYFEDPRYQTRTGWMIGSYNFINNVVWECPAETGTLVLFPSYLSHYTQPSNTLKGWRITLSFNIIPTGIANQGTLVEFSYE